MADFRFSHDFVNTVSKFFLGGPTLEGFYRYKSIDDIKDFFSEFFPFLKVKDPEEEDDRAAFLARRISALLAENQFERFVDIMLSPRYIEREFVKYENTAIPVDEAKKKSDENRELLDGMLYAEGYCLRVNNEGEHKIISQEEDLLKDEYVPYAQGSQALIYRHKKAPIVMKQLFPTLRESKDFVYRFQREYETTKALGDIYGVINVFDYDDEKYTYKMDALDCSLFDYFREHENVPVLTKIEFVTEIITVMAQVHRRNVIHRDLHPSNIFLKNGEIVIADFGLGKELTKIYSYVMSERTNLGHQIYSPPEQRNATYGFEAKTCDIYAIGKIINFIFTGNPENTHHMMSDVAKKATNINPKKRYKDAEHMKEQLETRLRNLKTIGKFKPFFKKTAIVDNTDNKMWGGYSKFKKTVT